jgi:hypothetical protein
MLLVHTVIAKVPKTKPRSTRFNQALWDDRRVEETRLTGFCWARAGRDFSP